jgi:hypothetical protein
MLRVAPVVKLLRAMTLFALAFKLLQKQANCSTTGYPKSTQKRNFDDLSAKLATIFASEVPCPGDGNLDKRVDGEDLANWSYFRALSGGKSSWYDFAIDGAYDGLTDDRDLAVIRQNLGTNCPKGR